MVEEIKGKTPSGSNKIIKIVPVIVLVGFLVYVGYAALASTGLLGVVSVGIDARCEGENIIATVKNKGSVSVNIESVIVSGNDFDGNPLEATPLTCSYKGRLNPGSSFDCEPVKASNSITTDFLRVEVRHGGALLVVTIPMNC